MEERAPTQPVAWLGGDISAALEDVHVPAYVLDRRGVIRWMNARSRTLFGDLVGRSFTEALPPEDALKARTELAKKVLETATTADYEVVLLRSSGKRVPVELHTVALADGRHVVGVFGIIDVKAAPAAPSATIAQLTPRQQEVLMLLAHGCSTAQMTAQLGVSRETIRNHVRAILRVLGVHSRLEAVAEARRRGLIG
jgi:PAS domain S-box-containing protein